jgi:DNA-binding transcriptional LysR family regulator
MNLQQIRYFLELARELHFWKTSEKMFITQSALSRHIIALEEELGFKLFERNKRSVKLTPAGKFLSEEWENLIVEIDSVHRHAKQIAAGETGEIKIGHPGSITHSVLPDLLNGFVRKYPDLHVELIELITLSLEQALLNYQIDIGFKRDPAENKGLESKKILTEHLSLVVAENHPLREKRLDDLSFVRNERFILPSLNSKHPYAELLRRVFKQHGFTPRIYFESEFGSTILGLVANGLGISLMPSSYRHQTPKGVRFIETSHETSLYVVWRKSDVNRVLHNFLKIVESSDFVET